MIYFSEYSKAASAEYVKVKTKNYVFENFICDDDTPNHLCAYPQSRTDKKVYVPDNITIIEDGSFKNNKFLEEVHIGKNLIKVKGNIFDNCENLKTIYIDSDKFVLEKDIFVDCPNIEHVFLNEKVFEKSLPNLFYKDKYKKIDIDYLIATNKTFKEINDFYLKKGIER